MMNSFLDLCSSCWFLSLKNENYVAIGTFIFVLVVSKPKS